MADSGARHTVALHECWAYSVCAESEDCAKPKAASAAAPAEWRPDPDTDLVLSDVHIGRAPSAAQRCTTVFRFRPGWAPAGCNGGAGGSSPCECVDRVGGGSQGSCASKDGGAQPALAVPLSSAAPAEVDEDGDVVVKRRRTMDGDAVGVAEGGMGGGTADGIVMHHAMATSLHSVGKQVRLLAFSAKASLAAPPLPGLPALGVTQRQPHQADAPSLHVCVRFFMFPSGRHFDAGVAWSAAAGGPAAQPAAAGRRPHCCRAGRGLRARWYRCRPRRRWLGADDRPAVTDTAAAGKLSCSIWLCSSHVRKEILSGKQVISSSYSPNGFAAVMVSLPFCFVGKYCSKCCTPCCGLHHRPLPGLVSLAAGGAAAGRARNGCWP